MIKCDFHLCIYNQKNRCVLEEIEISATGCCESGIIPNFPEDVLSIYKKELLDKFAAIQAARDKANQ